MKRQRSCFHNSGALRVALEESHHLLLDQRHLLICSECFQLDEGCHVKLGVLRRTGDAGWTDIAGQAVPKWAQSPKNVVFSDDRPKIAVTSESGDAKTLVSFPVAVTRETARFHAEDPAENSSGDRKHVVCVLDAKGGILKQESITNTRPSLTALSNKRMPTGSRSRGRWFALNRFGP